MGGFGLALPFAPIAAVAVRYGGVALAAYAVARRVEKGRRDQRAEDALDEVDEGVTLRRDGSDVGATGRFRRVIRLGSTGPGVEIDATSITRIRIKRTR